MTLVMLLLLRQYKCKQGLELLVINATLKYKRRYQLKWTRRVFWKWFELYSVSFICGINQWSQRNSLKDLIIKCCIECIFGICGI